MPPPSVHAVTIAFERPMDMTTAAGFGLWLDLMLRTSATDDPESDHGPFQIKLNATP